MGIEFENAPEKVQNFLKARKAVKANSTKGFSIKEIIGMAGTLAEAAVAVYYSDEIRKKYTAEEVGEISVYLVNGTKALMENDKQGLSELDELDENYLKSVWDDVEDAFSKYYTEKLASDLRGEDNEDEETE